MNDALTLDCVGPTQFSVIQNIHCNVSLKCFFFNFTEMFVHYYCYVCMLHWYFTR